MSYSYFFLFFLENRILHFMQIVSYNLHEVSDPIFYFMQIVSLVVS